MIEISSKLSREFDEFLSSPEVTPPQEVSAQILSKIHRKMNPSKQKLFFKILTIHTMMSFVSLSICSQFGIQSFPFFDAMKPLMSIVGPTYCMAFCGILYLGLSGLAFSFFLEPEEVRAIRRHKFSQLTALILISLGIFLGFGAQILFVPVMLWVIGSLLGGVVTLELGWLLRLQFRKHLVFGI